MKVACAAALSILIAGPASASIADDWLQARLDAVAAAARLPEGTAKVRIVPAASLTLSPARDGSLLFPAALLATAPDRDAVDGMLAVLLSNSRPRNAAKPSGVARDLLGTAAFLGSAAAGSDETSDRSPASETAKQVYLDAEIADSDRKHARSEAEARIVAARALNWTRTAGSCPASLTGWLRTLASGSQGQSFDGVSAARHLLADIGGAAGDPGDGCTAIRDAAFEAARSDLDRIPGPVGRAGK